RVPLHRLVAVRLGPDAPAWLEQQPRQVTAHCPAIKHMEPGRAHAFTSGASGTEVTHLSVACDMSLVNDGFRGALAHPLHLRAGPGWRDRAGGTGLAGPAAPGAAAAAAAPAVVRGPGDAGSSTAPIPVAAAPHYSWIAPDTCFARHDVPRC